MVSAQASRACLAVRLAEVRNSKGTESGLAEARKHLKGVGNTYVCLTEASRICGS